MAVAVGCLPNGNIVIWMQTILYFTAAVLGFFVTIPIGIVLRNFHGSCILYAQILDWRPEIIWPWSETSCDFILYMNLAVNIFYATFIGAATLLVAFKCDKKYADKIGKIHDWQTGYILNALNPVFLIVNILIWILEICAAAVLAAGIDVFCDNAKAYLNSPKTSLSTTTTTTVTPGMPTTRANCSFVYSVFDETLNETVTHTLNPCTTPGPTTTTTTTAYVALESCAALQKWDDWWANMRIIRGRTAGLDGSNFYDCLVLACVASFLLVIVWLIQMALNIGMMCRVCTCDVAEEKRKEDRTVLIAQRRSRLATPSVTPGGGVGRHTPQTFAAQPMGPGEPSQVGVPGQYGQPPRQPIQEPYQPYGRETPQEREKVTPPPSDSDVTDKDGMSPVPPAPQPHMMPPPQRRMEPSPRRPAEGPVVASPDTSFSPPSYHQLPPLQVRSPPSKQV